MAITSKTYEQAVATGDLFRWFNDAMASADRFNLNVQYLTDLLHGLDVKTDQALTGHDGRLANTETTLSAQATALNSKAVQSEMDQALADLRQQLSLLNDTYATDVEVAQVIQQVTQAWQGADTSLQEMLNTLINDRYTKVQTNDLLAGKADSLAVYTQAQVDDRLSYKAEKDQLSALETAMIGAFAQMTQSFNQATQQLRAA